MSSEIYVGKVLKLLAEHKKIKFIFLWRNKFYIHNVYSVVVYNDNVLNAFALTYVIKTRESVKLFEFLG